jgi:hypothetical protein
VPMSERDTLRQLHEPAEWITVRDVVRRGRYRLSGTVRMLRVPYDLFSPEGPIAYDGGLITYIQSGELRTASAANHALGDAHPGERVLVRLPEAEANEWWLCEVEQLDDVDDD